MKNWIEAKKYFDSCKLFEKNKLTPKRQIPYSDKIAICNYAGTKKKVLKYILDMTPKNFNNYFEPFLGSGPVYLNLDFKNKAIISDNNPFLIEVYNQVKNNLYNFMFHTFNVYDWLTKDNWINHFDYDNLNNFKKGNKLKSVADLWIRATLTISSSEFQHGKNGRINAYKQYKYYKNKTGFEIAKYKNIWELWTPKLKLFNHKLNNSQTFIICEDFRKVLKFAKKGDFVYLDPPYINFSNSEYNKKLNQNDNVDLIELIYELTEKKVFVMMSNTFTELLKYIYSSFYVYILDSKTNGNITGSKTKNRHEVLLLNYNFETGEIINPPPFEKTNWVDLR